MTTSNTYGRQTVVPLTNKSGGGVIAGDVVIVDTSNNDAFTITTSAAFTGLVGIAQETIANNAAGRILVGGYAALINVNASVTRGHYGATHTVAKQAASSGASRTAGTFVQFLTGGTTPDGNVFNPDLGTGGSTIITKDEGSTLSSSVTTLDFVGAGVVASGAGATTTVTIAGAAFSQLGYTSVGGTQETLVQYRFYTKKITLSGTAMICSISASIQGLSSQAESLRWAVWSDNAGTPQYVQAGTGIGFYLQTAVADGTTRWVSGAIGRKFAAGDYWIGVMCAGPSAAKINYDGSGTDRIWTATIDDITDAGSIWAVTDSTRKYSIYADILS